MLSVRDLLTVSVRLGLELITTENSSGLAHRYVRSVLVLREAGQWAALVGGELVCLDDTQLLERDGHWWRGLASSKAAALAVRVPRGRGVNVALIEEANRSGMPVVRVPETVSWTELSRLLYHEMARKTENVEASRDLLEQFTDLVLSGGTPLDIADRLRCLLGSTVCVFDANLRLLASTDERGTRLFPPHFLDGLRSLAHGGYPFSRHHLTLPDGSSCTVKLIDCREGLRGYLVVLAGANELSEHNLIALHHAAIGIALYLAQTKARQIAEKQEIHNVVMDLVLGRTLGPDSIRVRLRGTDFLPESFFCVALCGISCTDTDAHADQEGDRAGSIVAQALRESLTAWRKYLLLTDFGDHVLAVFSGIGTSGRESDRLFEDLRTAVAEVRRLMPSIRVIAYVGDIVPTLELIPKSFEVASDILALGRALSIDAYVVSSESLGSYRVLQRLHDDPAAREFVMRLLGSILEHRSSLELLRTLRALLTHNLRNEVCARVLHVHPNTVRYRRRILETLVGGSLADSQRSFDLQLALRLLELTCALTRGPELGGGRSVHPFWGVHR